MADPYNTAMAAADAQMRSAFTPPAAVGPAALPPQFVGRYAGAPVQPPVAVAPVKPYVPPPAGVPATPQGLPQMGWPMALPYTAAQANAMPAPASAAPAAPTAFVPRYDTNSPALKGAIGAPVPSATTAPGVVQPANAASVPPATPAQPPGTIRGIGIGGVPLDIPAPTAAPAPSLAAMSAVGHMGDFNPASLQRPAGQSPTIGADGQWNVPPLPANMQEGGGEGGVPLPGGEAGGGIAPDGTEYMNFRTAGAGGTGYIGSRRGGAVMGGGLIDPEGRINDAFDAQSDRANAFINRALDYIQQGGNIFERATRGRAIGNILAATMGPNNVGQVQGQGIDSLNNANAGITQSANYANANRYASDNQLVGHAMTVGEQAQEFVGTPKPIATEEDYNNFGIKQGARTAYAMPDGSQPKPIVVPKQGGGVKVGQKVTQADGTYPLGNGQKVVVKNGQVTEVQ